MVKSENILTDIFYVNKRRTPAREAITALSEKRYSTYFIP